MDILKKLVALVFCYASATIPSFSQSGYLYKWVDFKQGKNAGLNHGITDNPGIILLDGYLKGHLKGYATNFTSEVMRRGPIDSLEIPPAWEPKDDYYYEMDRVTYNGKFYEAIADMRLARPPSEDKAGWRSYEILGMPVSTKNSFPGEKDILGKSEFLLRMISREQMEYRMWDPGGVYLSSEVVSYRGNAYITSNDITSFTPPDKDHVNWDIFGESGPQFFRQDEMVGLEVFTHYQIQSGDTLYSPQMIAPVFFSYQTESRHAVVHFLYEDAINYLNSVKLPLLYPGPYGYFMHQQLMLDAESKIALLERVKEQLKLKSVKLPAESIKNPVILDLFLKDTTRIANTSQWSIHQDLNSGELILQQLLYHDKDNDYDVVPMASLPVKSFEKFLPVKPVPFNTYWEKLADQSAWEPGADSAYVDSLKPAPRKINPRKTVNSFFFLDSYKAKVDNSNPELGTALAEVWKVVEQAFHEKKLHFKFPVISFYPWEYDWSSTTLEGYGWTFFKSFTLGPTILFEPDSLDAPKKFTSFTVTYKKVISLDKKQKLKFIPQEVSIEFTQGNEDFAPESRYIVEWHVLKEILAKQNSPTLIKFTGAVENATLAFHQSEVSYGLIENKE